MLTLTKIQKPQLDLSINLQPISFSAQLEYKMIFGIICFLRPDVDDN